jgi:hypothetical protein
MVECGYIFLRNISYCLTDRVGNFKELQPYIKVYEKANYVISNDYVGIIDIEHDDVLNNIRLVFNETDGKPFV